MTPTRQKHSYASFPRCAANNPCQNLRFAVEAVRLAVAHCSASRRVGAAISDEQAIALEQVGGDTRGPCTYGLDIVT